MGVILIINIVTFIVKMIVVFKFFEKADQNPWKAIIQIVNDITLLEIANMNPLWVIISIVLLLGNFIKLGIFGIIFSIANLVVMCIVLNIKIDKQFNLSVPFAIGMMFFPYIFYAIIAWGPFSYNGTQSKKNKVNNAFLLNGNNQEQDDYVPKSDFFRD